MTLRALAPGKVNLCLFLGPEREDGRHELVTLFESLSLADTVTMTTATSDEVICPGVDGPNLAASALEQLRARGWGGSPVRVEIEKQIPVAAGMAGGSADAAAVLRLASELAPGRPEEIAAIAAVLGSDVPAQLSPGLTLGTGAGDEVEPLLPLAPHAFVIVPSRQGLSTADVYREADRLGLPRDAGELEARRVELEAALEPDARVPSGYLINDLELAAVSLCPSVADGMDAVRACGADHALVCGSGPTVAGLFWGTDALRRAEEAAIGLPGAVAAHPVQAEFGFPVMLPSQSS